jgi:hypothetical protein
LGTGRFWELSVERCRLTPEAAPHRWEWLGAAAELQSPSNVDDP